ncbi:hypothetical protein QWZ13_10360 [Reinekea marina]|nr:hypothetical protein [Reinekea marina]MDN3649316.1 hypothetical protein [Reinekea marina]
MRQLEWLTNIDLTELTYQHKIDEFWGESAQWHSLYSHLANDVHFFGVSFLCLFIGFFLARVWFSVLDNGSFYGACLIPLFVLLIFFIPANNQIFGFLGTFSSFSIITLLWLKEGKSLMTKRSDL